MPGYNINLEENKIGKRHLCSFCEKLLRNAVQLCCGHLCCNSCVEEYLKGAGDLFNCPVDGERFREVFCDRWRQREILNLEVNCSNLKAGCKWIGLVRKFEEHVESCPFGSVNCGNDGCHIFLSRRDYDKHTNEECQYRKSVAVIESKIMKEGDNVQPRDSDGINNLIIRRLEKLGKKIEDLDETAENSKGKHITLTNYVNDIYKDFIELAANVESRDFDGINLINERLEKLEKQIEDLNETAENMQIFKSRYMTFVGVVSEMANKIDSNENQLQLKTNDDGSKDGVIEELVKKVNYQAKVGDALSNWNRRLEVRINSLELELALKSITIVEQNDQLDTVEPASYNGILIWPIGDFMKKRQDAIIGKTVSLYSPVFYTDRQGYKLRVRIYLNGDGLGKGTHISLFFVVCKSRYDDVLPWPFRQKVTMMILDQDTVQHVVESFEPDPLNSSFQKPKNEMNIASGCPLFMPLADLDRRSHAPDDIMIVKVKVEPDDK